MRTRSKKRARLYRNHRIPLVISLLAERPTCERCHLAPSVDVHERKSRARGGSILDLDNLVALCRTCHDWVTTHPALAHDEGFTLNSWE